MANRIYSVEDIQLQNWNDKDGNPKSVRIHPLTIKKLRELFKKFDFQDKQNSEKTMIDIAMEAAAYCMETFEPELASVEVLEDHVDQPTVYYILKIAAGIEFDDANLTSRKANLTGQD